MSIFSFDKLLSIIETVCEILLGAIGRLKDKDDKDMDDNE